MRFHFQLASVTLPSSPDVALPTDVISSSAEVVTATDPAFSSLGLCSYSPAGLYQSILEYFHVTADMSWCGAIALSTFLESLRTIQPLCVFPAAVSIRFALYPLLIVHQRNTMEVIHRKFKEKQENIAQGPSDSVKRIKDLHQKLQAAKAPGNEDEVMQIQTEILELQKGMKGGFLKTTFYPILEVFIVHCNQFISISLTLIALGIHLPFSLLWFPRHGCCAGGEFV
jgi:hypothetical protein